MPSRTIEFQANAANVRGRSLVRSLFISTLSALVATALIVMGAAAVMAFYSEYGSLTEHDEQAASALEAQMSGNSRYRLNLDAADILAVDHDIEAIGVLGADGMLRDQVGAADVLSDAVRTTNLTSSDVSWSLHGIVVSKPFRSVGAWRDDVGLRLVIVSHAAPWDAVVVFLIASVIALTVAGMVLWFIFHGQIGPIIDLVDRLITMAEGNLEQTILGTGRRDEIGAMARAVDLFKTKLIDHDRLRLDAEHTHAASLRRHSQMEARVETFRTLIHEALRDVAGLTDQMTVAAEGLATISAQTSHRAGDAFDAIRSTTANVTSVANATGELATSIREIETQVDQTRGSVINATRSAAETQHVIQGLSTKAKEIEEIIELIQTIAAQTNLLSLNATIEAARAGEAGRGFAVVAQEVKLLADQTARASQHVADHILSIQAATARAVAAIASIDGVMAEANRFSSIISVAVERQARATAEISGNASQAAHAAASAAANMKSLASAVGETDQSSAQVRQSADDIRMQTMDISTTIEHFLRDTAAIRLAAV